MSADRVRAKDEFIVASDQIDFPPTLIPAAGTQKIELDAQSSHMALTLTPSPAVHDTAPRHA